MSHQPYLMPDGRPLGAYLQETQSEPSKRSTSAKTRRGRRADRDSGWTHRSSFRPATEPLGDEGTDDGSRLGRDRRRRYLNEKILRAMAGALTASDMEALFKPVPFGETGHKSVFTQVTEPDVASIWDLFRSIDEDKQNRTLQKWEAHVKESRQSRDEDPTAPSLPASGLAALQSWARVPRKAREALKKTSPEVVDELELPILDFLEQEAEEELELQLQDSFQRLMAHGVASFHNLHSHTLPSGPTIVRHSESSTGHSGRSSNGVITCADVVFALASQPAGGLTPSALDMHLHRLQHGTPTASSVS